MQIIDISAGVDIRDAAVQLVKVASTGGRASCEFNGITLTAEEGATADEIVDFYMEESARRAKAYRNSPEGQKAERQRQIRIENLQRKADGLMAQLSTLDFESPRILLEWLSEIEDARDHIGVKVDTQLLISTFVAHGYLPNANTDDKFNEADPDNYARWIIGQAIKVPYFPLVGSFRQKWQEKFVTAAHRA
jgi:hypothetical protein